MKFAILGAGGVGGYYGGLLARNGHQVSVLARTANLAVLKERGLEVLMPGETFTAPVQASDDIKDFGVVDCALLAVKNYSGGDRSLCDGAGRARRVNSAATEWR